MAEIFSLIWLMLEWVIFIMMILPLPIFFYFKYREDKIAENKGSMAFNLGYMLFFIFTSLNQLIYIIDAVSDYSTVIGWNEILSRGIQNTVLIEFELKSQITLMLCFFFLSFIPIMYPIEKYLRKSEKFPTSVLLGIGAAISGILWLIFCYFGIPQPLEIIWLQVVIAIILLIACAGLLISIIAFLFFYLKVAINSTGAVRKKSLIVTFGIFFMYFSLIGGNLTRPDVIGTALELIGPVFLVVGIIVLIYGFKIKGM